MPWSTLMTRRSVATLLGGNESTRLESPWTDSGQPSVICLVPTAGIVCHKVSVHILSFAIIRTRNGHRDLWNQPRMAGDACDSENNLLYNGWW